jgi:hypothetical protein
MACAHPDSQYAARIATTLDVLWERGSLGIYDVLFRPQPGVYALWNSVLVLRQVRRVLHELRPQYTGRAAALIDHGLYLLAHLVFRRLDTDAIDEPDSKLEWAANATEQVQESLQTLLPTTVATIDELFTERAQIRAVCSDIARCRQITEHVLSSEGTPRPASTDKYRRVPPGRTRRPNAVSVLVDKAVLPEGEALSLVTSTPGEAEAMRGWLAEDPKRSRASWTPQRGKPILWAADGKHYSPSGLISHMWELAGWENRPVANQGTARWAVSSGRTLAELAWRALGELDSAEDSD